MHEPVMVAEVLEHLAPARGGVFVDCTVGLGGHARALLDAGASRVIGLDRDPAALAEAGAALAPYEPRVQLVHSRLSTPRRGARRAGYRRPWTGCSRTWACRRCSSMRPDAGSASGAMSRSTCGWTRRRVRRRRRRYGEADERTLADVIYEFGEERQSRRIARAIVSARVRTPIATTGQLADVVRRAIPRSGVHADRSGDADVSGDPHLGQPGARGPRHVSGGGGPAAAAWGADGGDQFPFARGSSREAHASVASGDGGRADDPNEAAVVPSEAEIERNPRARSAKLRAAERRTG